MRENPISEQLLNKRHFDSEVWTSIRNTDHSLNYHVSVFHGLSQVELQILHSETDWTRSVQRSHASIT